MDKHVQSRQHHICILGGTGFVGTHLAARLARDGHRIRILTRRRARHRELLVLPGVELVDAEIHDLDALKRHVAGCDVVINLVGVLNETGRRSGGFQRAHVELPRHIAIACEAAGIRRVLHMSALGADPSGPSMYQRTKAEGEALLHAWEGLHVTSFRPSVIFGPGDSFLNRFAGLLKLAPLLFPLPCPEARFQPVYVGDVAEVFARALDNPATHGQSYALCGPRQYTLEALVRYTARVLGLRRAVIGLGDGLSRLQAAVMERVPGKPFSRDNYLSMQRPNVCGEPFPSIFGIEPVDLECVVPSYLGRKHQRARLDEFRRNARR